MKEQGEPGARSPVKRAGWELGNTAASPGWNGACLFQVTSRLSNPCWLWPWQSLRTSPLSILRPPSSGKAWGEHCPELPLGERGNFWEKLKQTISGRNEISGRVWNKLSSQPGKPLSGGSKEKQLYYWISIKPECEVIRRENAKMGRNHSSFL